MQKFIFDIRSRGFVLVVVGFLIFTALVYSEVSVDIEESIIISFQNMAGNSTIDYTFWIFTEIGGIWPILILSFVLFIKRSTRRIGLILVLAILLSTVAAGYFKDYVIERDRPSLEFLGSEFPIDPEADTGTLGGKGSYPSGHSARASVVAFVIGYVISERYPNGWKLLWLFPIVVGISRIYLLQHYPLDVVGGILFGLIIANILSLKLKLPTLSSKSKT